MPQPRRILHLSDIHFGRIFEPALLYLKQFIADQSNNIDLIAVSGDWTQRARSRQFRQAVEFIESLGKPVISVPGNHDIPLYNVISRLFYPYRKYRRFIEPVTIPEYVDGTIAAIGMSTVNRFSVAGGKVKEDELARVVSFFNKHFSKTKILICHHPIGYFLNELEICGIFPDLILSGHTHACEVNEQSFPSAKKVIMAACGTTTSDRFREGKPNGFNILEVASDDVKVETYEFNTGDKQAPPSVSVFKFEK